MANLQAISKPGFLKKSWKHSSDYLFSAKDTICTLGATEIPHAMMGMPLAFVLSDRGYSVVAVLGLQQGRNYFLKSDGQWRGNYIPAAYRAYPFVLAENLEEKGATALCIYTDDNYLIEGEDHFFNQDLEFSQPVSQKRTDTTVTNGRLYSDGFIPHIYRKLSINESHYT